MKAVTRLAGVFSLLALTGAPQLQAQALVDLTSGKTA